MLFENCIHNKAMSFPPRAVTILMLCQIFIVTGGLLLTRSFRKLHDKTLGETFGDKLLPSFSNLAMTWGWLLLLIPMCWTLYCLRASTGHGTNGEVRRMDFWIGLCVLAGLFWMCSFSVLAHMNALQTRSF
ncbi:MAG TPA: hypothetical protein DIT13_11360 [Verrucomicrobiales bacterium]|nr:hypothetical protein [Verrucomicrobiales bacterium]